MDLRWLLLLPLLLLPHRALAQVEGEEGPRFDFVIDLSKLKPVKKPPAKVTVKPKAKAVVKPTVKVKPKPVVVRKKAEPPPAKPKPVVRKQAAKPKPPKPSWAGLPEIPVVRLTQADMADIPGQFVIDLDLVALQAAGLDLATIPIPELAARLGLRPEQIRSVQRRFLFSAVLNADPQQATALAANPLVAEVYPDTWIKAAGNSLPLSWGLDRLDSPVLPLDGRFDRDFGDYETRIYLFDSGVDAAPAELGSRVTEGASFVKKVEDPKRRCREHGTEMASLLAGQTTGAAPKAAIVSLVVLPCERDQPGLASSVIEAVEWVLVSEADFGDGKPAVANMSLSGKFMAKLNKAVKVLTKSGIAVVAAAGNESEDACKYSPGSAADAITVAATGPEDETPDFSNFGPCVDFNAPGRLLTALTEGNQYVAVNGTSGATALVSGLLARSLLGKGSSAASTWLSDAAVPAKLWRKDDSNVFLAQASASWRGLCRLGATSDVRAKPNGKIIATMPANALVSVEKKQAQWLRVAGLDGAGGWLPENIKAQPLLLEADADVACGAIK